MNDLDFMTMDVETVIVWTKKKYMKETKKGGDKEREWRMNRYPWGHFVYCTLVSRNWTLISLTRSNTNLLVTLHSNIHIQSTWNCMIPSTKSVLLTQRQKHERRITCHSHVKISLSFSRACQYISVYPIILPQNSGSTINFV